MMRERISVTQGTGVRNLYGCQSIPKARRRHRTSAQRRGNYASRAQTKSARRSATARVEVMDAPGSGGIFGERRGRRF